MIYQNLKLHEWIDKGRANGTIGDVVTVIWAYCMDEPTALKWIAAIVSGQMSEHDALGALQPDDCVTHTINELKAASDTPPNSP